MNCFYPYYHGFYSERLIKFQAETPRDVFAVLATHPESRAGGGILPTAPEGLPDTETQMLLQEQKRIESDKGVLLGRLIGLPRRRVLEGLQQLRREMEEVRGISLDPVLHARALGIDFQALLHAPAKSFDFRCLESSPRQRYLNAFKISVSGGYRIDFGHDRFAEARVGLADLFREPRLELLVGPGNRKHRFGSRLALVRSGERYCVEGTGRKAYVYSGDQVFVMPASSVPRSLPHSSESGPVLGQEGPPKPPPPERAAGGAHPETPEILHGELQAFVAGQLRKSHFLQSNRLEGLPPGEADRRLNDYASAFIRSMELGGLASTPQNAAFLLALQETESDFELNPQKSGASIWEKAQREFGSTLRVVRGFLRFNAPLRQKFDGYTASLRQCATESDLYRWAQALVKDLEDTAPGGLGGLLQDSYALKVLQKAAAKFKDFGESGSPLAYAINKLRKSPGTAGVYQVNVDILSQAAQADIAFISRHPDWRGLVKEGRIARDLLIRSMFRDPRDTDLLPAPVIDGFVLRYYVKPILDSHDADRDGSLTGEEALYAAADFHAGRYASRNAALQQALNDELGLSLVLDGDLTYYNKEGKPDFDRPSSTLKALTVFASGLSPEAGNGKSPEVFVREFVALGQSPGLTSHPLWQALIQEKRRSSRVLPGGAKTAETEAHLSGFRVSSGEDYARSMLRRYKKYLA